MITLSIIIVNWNTRDLLMQCLESVYATVQGLEFEVWVVDNASTDGSPAVVRETFPGVCLIENADNLGFARANNQALTKTEGKYILLLNSDAILLEGSAESMAFCLERQPTAGVCGAMLLNPDGSFQASYSNFPTLWSEFLHLFGLSRLAGMRNYPSQSQADSLDETKADWVGGACFMARRSAIDAVGVLDETYEMYGEELDWCRRMWNSGWEVIYCPQAQVIHHGGQSTKDVPAWKMLRIYKSKLRFFEKYNPGWKRMILILSIRFSCVLKAVYFWITHQLLTSSSSARDWHNYWNIVWAKF